VSRIAAWASPYRIKCRVVREIGLTDIESVHRVLQTVREQTFDRIAGALDCFAYNLKVGVREGLQDVARSVLCQRRPSHANANTVEVGTKLGDQRRDASMTSGPAAMAHAQAPNGKIDIVVHDNQILDLPGPREPSNCGTGHVHILLRLHQSDWDSTDGSTANDQSLMLGSDRNRPPLR
jgi:hypothetical protein